MKVGNITNARRLKAYKPPTTLEYVLPNEYNGHYSLGKSFSSEKWYHIVDTYMAIISKHGKCSARTLAKSAKISRPSAQKAVTYYLLTSTIPPTRKKGHGRTGVGSLIGLFPSHHDLIYRLYKANPARPLMGYVEEVEKECGILLHKDVIERWFLSVGPHRGST